MEPCLSYNKCSKMLVSISSTSSSSVSIFVYLIPVAPSLTTWLLSFLCLSVLIFYVAAPLTLISQTLYHLSLSTFLLPCFSLSLSLNIPALFLSVPLFPQCPLHLSVYLSPSLFAHTFQALFLGLCLSLYFVLIFLSVPLFP